MGFNIGVFSQQISDSFDCDYFIERTFYNFVNEGERYGSESILIKSGQYYGLDLSPLLKLVYILDEPTPEYIQENLQPVDLLLPLLISFRDGIQKDNTVCDKIQYICYDPIALSQADLERMKAEVDEEMLMPLLDIIGQEKKKMEENPNPWKSYFEEGQMLEHLNNLIKSLQCFKNKGATHVYLTAG